MYNSRRMKHVFGAVAASFLVAVAILLLSWTTYFAQLNSAAYDFTLRLAGPITPTSPTVIVAIDEDSLTRIGAWPWSRENLAQLLTRIEAGRPRVVAFDMLLDDRKAEAGDVALANAITSAPAVVLATRLDSSHNPARWLKPAAPFLAEHVHLGHVHADPDFDGITRRVISPKIGEARAVSAFGIEVLRSAGLPLKPGSPKSPERSNIIRPETVNIRFVGDNKTFRHIPAWQVLSGDIQQSDFQDKIVLIGATFEGLGDEWFTPFAETGQKMSGVEIHANVIETLYAGRSITDVPDWMIALGLLAMILVMWRVDRYFDARRLYAIVILAAPSVLVVLTSWLLMKYFYVWLPFPSFLAALVVVVPGLGVRKILRVNRDLDGKIQRLSLASLYERRRAVNDNRVTPAFVKDRATSEVMDPEAREGWLTAIDLFERQTAELDKARTDLFGTGRHNSRWKLHAVEFFTEELMRFLSFNSAVLASIEDVIIVSDPAGRVVYQNAAARRLTGYCDEPGFAVDYVASLLSAPSLLADFANVLAHQTPVMNEFVPATKEAKFFNLTLSPISRSGVVFSMHDVTAQRELNQAKNDMVSLVSHELRTPLTSIRGYSDMLLKYNLVEEKGKEFLGTIIEESGRLSHLIQSFLDIAYIESGKQKLTLSTFELTPVLKDIAMVLGPIAAAKQIDLQIARPGEGLSLRADKLLVSQAVTNLAANAVKYSPPGTAVQLAANNGAGRVQIRVSDQGPGIPADETSKIFEKFYRRGNKETREQSGFGLGLAFVKEVVGRHGGEVTVESEVGKGSVFTISIPVL